MFSVYTQFIRNFLCVCKSLLPVDSLWNHIALPMLPAPLNEVSFIEFGIALTQFGAVCFNIVASYSDMIQGYRAYRRNNKFLIALDKLSLSGGTTGSSEYTILRHGLGQEKTAGIVRCWVVSIAIS